MILLPHLGQSILIFSEDEEDVRAWGVKKSAYIGQDEYESEDEEAADEEEQEMKKLQQQRSALLATEDFGEQPTITKKTKTTKKKQEKEKPSKTQVERVTKSLKALTKDEKLEFLMNDSPELFDLLEEFKDKAAELKDKLQPLMDR